MMLKPNSVPDGGRRLRITISQGAFLPVPPRLGGAVEKAWYALGREMAARGHQVTHIGRTFEGLPGREQDAGVTYVRVPGFATPASMLRLKWCDLLYSLRVRRVIPPGDIHVINTFWLPVVERRQSRGVPYIHVGRYPKGQLRWFPRRCVLQTVSSPIEAAIQAEIGGDGSRVRVIPYPLSPTYLVPLKEDASPVMLFAGRIHREKGLHLLVEACARWQQSGGRPWPLRIVGPWETSQGGSGREYRDDLLATARHHALDVQLLDPVFDEQRLVALYGDAAVFVYPSLAEKGETFGLAVLEAMAAGGMPVVSNLACFRDFVSAGENGFVFDHRTPDPAGNLAQTLAAATGDPATIARLRASAWATARRFRVDQVAEQYLRDFVAVSEDNRSPGASPPR